MKLWDARTLHGHTSWVSTVAFSFDGKIITSGSADDAIKGFNAFYRLLEKFQNRDKSLDGDWFDDLKRK